MKKTILILLNLLWLVITAAVADVEFEVFYTDKEGEGFHIRPEACQSLEEALAMVGSWLDHDAIVRIEAKSIIDPNIIYYAYAASNDETETMFPGIYPTHLARKILFKEYDGGWNYDAIIICNFFCEDSYAFGDEVLSDNYDFKAIIVHEITHALGFTSWIEDSDNFTLSQVLEGAYFDYQRLNDPIRKKEYSKIIEQFRKYKISPEFILLNWNRFKEDEEGFTYFDTFLVDEEGKKVVDTENLKFLRKDLFKLKDSDPQKSLYFQIPNRNYSYRLNGMDASHFKLSKPTVMQMDIGYGPWIRQWSEEEREIMQALGYKLKNQSRGQTP